MTYRKKNLILSIITLLFADLVYFIWMPYPKSILKTVGSSTFIFDILTNCLYFSVFAIILLVSVKSMAEPTFKVAKKTIITSIAACIGVQLGFDFLCYIAGRFLRFGAFLSNDLFTVLGMFVLVFVTIKLVGGKAVNRKRFLVLSLLLLLGALTVAVIFDIRDIQNILYDIDKYLPLSSELFTIINNIEFSYEIRNALLDFISGIILISALFFSTSSIISEDKEAYHTKEAHFVTRIVAILILTFAMCGLKVLILPQNVVRNVTGLVTSGGNRDFNLNNDTIIVNRALNFHDVKKVYHITHFKLKYQGKRLLKFDFDGEYTPKKYHWEGNVVVMDDDECIKDINGTEVYVYYNKAIAYVKNGEPYAIKFTELSEEKFDEILLGLCEKLLVDGRLDCFEYIGQYIMQYDPEFIKPYIERYIEEDFTEKELQNSGNISTEYIAKIAQGF